MLVLVLVLVVAAVGCKRQGERSNPVVSEAESNVGAAPVDAARPKPLNAVCPPRAASAAPGPTKPDAVASQRLGLPGEVVDVKDDCVKHSDCSERAHGRCVHKAAYETNPFGQRRVIPAHNECVYEECMSDEECRQTGTHEPRAELICVCTPERNTCTFANCRVDSDCPAPFKCGSWSYCHSAADACRASSDCKAGDECVYSWEEKHYICRKEERIAPD